MLRTIDMLWMEHLETMECLRQSVSLKAYGQRDPLVEYKNEGKRLFDQMLQTIDNAIIDILLKAELKQGPVEQKKPAFAKASSGKIGRNSPCPCGSDLKYKKCCGK